MKTITQSPRRGVSHTPQTHTSLSHTPQLNTPPLHTFHHRRSIRLKGHDYSDDGFYFITICTKDRHCYFGRVIDGKMVLNEKGQIVKNEWLNTANVRQGDVILHEYVVMPNHFHAIVEICRGGVSHTPQMHTPQIHTTQIHTPQSNTPNNGLTSNNGVCDTINNGICDTTDNGVYDITNNGVCDVKDEGVSKVKKKLFFDS